MALIFSQKIVSNSFDLSHWTCPKNSFDASKADTVQNDSLKEPHSNDFPKESESNNDRTSDNHAAITVHKGEENEITSIKNVSTTPPNSEAEDFNDVEVTLDDSVLEEGLDDNNTSTICVGSFGEEISMDDVNSSFTHRDLAVEVVTEAVETAKTNVASHHCSQEAS